MTLFRLDDFVRELRKQGFTVGMDTWQQLLHLYEAINLQEEPDALRDAFAVVLAKNEEQRTLFYKLFPQYLHLHQQKASEETPTPSTDATQDTDKSTSTPNQTEKKVHTRPYYLVAAVLVVLITLGSYWYFDQAIGTKAKQTDTNVDVAEQERQNADSAAQEQVEKTVLEQPISKLQENLTNKLAQVPPTKEDTSQATQIETEEQTQAKRKKAVEEAYAKLQKKEWHKARMAEVKAWLRQDLVRQQWWQTLRWIVLASFFVLYSLVLLYRHSKRRLVARRRFELDSPSVWPIYIDKRQLQNSETMVGVANSMRQREQSQHQRLDVQATLKASIRRGGYLDPQYRHGSQLKEFLLLIDRNHAQNHQGQLFEHFYQMLVDYNVVVERYFFDSTPQVCFQSENSKGIRLEDLQRRYHKHYVLLFGEAASLLHPITGKPHQWAHIFPEWKRRAVFTPRPTKQWGRREVQLQSLFQTVLPTGENGMLVFAEQLSQSDNQSTNLRDIKFAANNQDTNIHIDEKKLLQSLQEQFPDLRLQKWIAACAQYPELYWDLTIYLGKQLEHPQQAPLVTHDNLRRLAHLPWFKNGLMPDSVRQQLMQSKWLNENEQEQVLEAILQLLDQNLQQHFNADTPEGQQNRKTEAYQRLLMQLYTNKLLLKKYANKKQQKALERGLVSTQEQTGVQEQLALEYENQRPDLLSFVLPKRMNRYFYQHKSPLHGTRLWVKASVLVLGLLAAFAATRAPQAHKRMAVVLHGYAGQAAPLQLTSLMADTAASTGTPYQLQNDVLYFSLPASAKPDSLFLQTDSLLFSTPYSQLRAASHQGAIQFADTSLAFVQLVPRMADSIRLQVRTPEGQTLPATIAQRFIDGNWLAAKSLNNTATLAVNNILFADSLQFSLAADGYQTQLYWWQSKDTSLQAWTLKPISPSTPQMPAWYTQWQEALLAMQSTANYHTAMPQLRAAYNTAEQPDSLKQQLDQQETAANTYAQALLRKAEAEVQSNTLERVKTAIERLNKTLLIRPNYTEAQNLLVTARQNEVQLLAAASGQTSTQLSVSYYNKAIDYLSSNNTDSLQVSAQYCDTALNLWPQNTKASLLRQRVQSKYYYEQALRYQNSANEDSLYRGLRYSEAALEKWPQNNEATTLKELLNKKIVELNSVDLRSFTETINGVSFTMKAIKGGEFQMGEGNERHPVTVPDFYMGETVVTNAQFAAFLNEKGNQEEGGVEWINLKGSYKSEKCRISQQGQQFIVDNGYENNPVIYVSWYAAKAYVKWLSKKTRKKYALPSEAQWEYAAGGGVNNRTKWAGTNNETKLTTYAIFDKNSLHLGEEDKDFGTHRVRSKAPNQLGLYDMSGNVWEWCDNYNGAPADGTAWTSGNSSSRVYRGGSWGSNASRCRVAYRSNDGGYAFSRSFILGFRVVLVP